MQKIQMVQVGFSKLIRLLILVILPSIWFCFPSFGQIPYIEQSDMLGINHSQNQYTLGNGISFVDFNQDGWDDLTIGTPDGQFIEFYINQGGWFQKTSSPLCDHISDSKQVLWNDIDNDGDLDLFVATFTGQIKLYQNQGDLILKDITIDAGLPTAQRRSYGATWGDYNRDGWLDLYVSYRVIDFTAGQHENILFRNNGDGSFTDESKAMNASDRGKVPFMSVIIDLNGDLWPDIYTANDRNTGNTVLQNEKGSMFKILDQEENGAFQISGMGIATGDVNQDGLSDLYITNIADGNIFLSNVSADDSEIQFDEISKMKNISFDEISWGANFIDFDNDTDLDLYVSGSKTGVDAKSSALFENNLGQFVLNQSGREGDTLRSYANAIGDVNNDGKIDIMVQNNFPGTSQLWVNQTNDQNWIKIDLKGVLSNADAIGSKIEVYAHDIYQSKQVVSASSFLGQNSQYQHFGLGHYDVVDSVLVTWPTGHQDRFYDLNSNSLHSFYEGQSTQDQIDIDPEIKLISANKEVENESLVLFPNPSEGFIYFPTTIEVKKIIISDINGQFINSYTGLEDHKIDLNHLHSGLYFIHIFDGSNNEFMTKWIKI